MGPSTVLTSEEPTRNFKTKEHSLHRRPTPNKTQTNQKQPQLRSPALGIKPHMVRNAGILHGDRRPHQRRPQTRRLHVQPSCNRRRMEKKNSERSSHDPEGRPGTAAEWEPRKAHIRPHIPTTNAPRSEESYSSFRIRREFPQQNWKFWWKTSSRFEFRTRWNHLVQKFNSHWRWRPVRTQKHVCEGNYTLLHIECHYQSNIHLPSLNQLNDMLKITQIRSLRSENFIYC